jgi:hypothetical protein
MQSLIHLDDIFRDGHITIDQEFHDYVCTIEKVPITEAQLEKESQTALEQLERYQRQCPNPTTKPQRNKLAKLESQYQKTCDNYKEKRDLHNKAYSWVDKKIKAGNILSHLMTIEFFQRIDRLARDAFKSTWMYMGSDHQDYAFQLVQYYHDIGVLVEEILGPKERSQDENRLFETVSWRVKAVSNRHRGNNYPLPLPTEWVIQRMRDLLALTPLSWREVSYPFTNLQPVSPTQI